MAGGEEGHKGAPSSVREERGSGCMQDRPVFQPCCLEFCIASQNKGPGLTASSPPWHYNNPRGSGEIVIEISGNSCILIIFQIHNKSALLGRRWGETQSEQRKNRASQLQKKKKSSAILTKQPERKGSEIIWLLQHKD